MSKIKLIISLITLVILILRASTQRRMKMTNFLEQAVELALENVKSGGEPFGAVLVKSSTVISEGVNELHLTHDITGHAELVAIKKAQAALKTLDLSDCVIYASGEPCAMCLSAMYFSNIKTVYYAQSIEDASAVGLTKSSYIYDEINKDKNKRHIKMIKQELIDENKDPMKLWQER